MKFLGCLFGLFLSFLFIILLIPSALMSLVAKLLGVTKRDAEDPSVKKQQQTQDDSAPRHVFKDDEGEYVDFEEVPDSNAASHEN